MRTLRERVDHAQAKSDLHASIAQTRADEAIGAAKCGFPDRAEEAQNRADFNAEEADIWAATAAELRTRWAQEDDPTPEAVTLGLAAGPA